MENSAVQAEKKPFITIGIASYNYAEYLPKAFEAIRRQRFTDYEILYCDDGSTDDSLPVICGLIADHPEMQIRLVAGENGGIMTNKNRILENARGEYLMICDADDWMDDNCLQVLGETARRTGADRVVSSAKEVDDDGRVVNTFPISKVYQAHIPTYAAGYWLFGFASKKYHPTNDVDMDSWNKLNLRTRYYTPRLHIGAFALPAFLEEMLVEVEK